MATQVGSRTVRHGLRGHGSPKMCSDSLLKHYGGVGVSLTRRKVWKCTRAASRVWLKFFAKVVRVVPGTSASQVLQCRSGSDVCR